MVKMNSVSNRTAATQYENFTKPHPLQLLMLKQAIQASKIRRPIGKLLKPELQAILPIQAQSTNRVPE